jgi:predicted GNAT family N-acyltransferase
MNVRKCNTRAETEAALKVRRTVFVVEQKIDPALEFDGRDKDAAHIAAFDGEKAVGAARILPQEGNAEIGRLAVLPEYRGRGIGSAIMREAECVARLMGLRTAVIHAQSHALNMYRKLRYAITSQEFIEAGIPHIEMRKDLPPASKVMCKVCGAENAFLSDRDREVACAKCGYRMVGRDLWQVV